MKTDRSSLLHRPMLAWAALLLAFALHAQRPAHYEHPDADLVHAQELFDKAKFSASRYEAERVMDRIRRADDPSRIAAEHLAAISAVRLFNADAPNLLLAFIDAHPEDLRTQNCYFELTRHYFSSKRWKDVIAWGARVDETALTPADQEEFHFKQGYAHFQNGDKDKALARFNHVKDGQGPYAGSATYYTAHIDYERGHYAMALKGFEKLTKDEAFGRVVPYYIAQIRFLQGDYEGLLAYVDPLLKDPEGAKRVDEISRLAGETYYRTGRYAEALPYLEKSAQRTGLPRGDRYILGYTYYRAGDCRKALDQLNLVANGNDSLAQLASYHMADCYLKLNEKNYARTAFKKAYDLGIDRKVTEDALFNYAKLAYELSFDPYNEAILALRNYLRTYPDSPRHDEAQEFLMNVYIKTRNYEDALATLDAIKNKDLRLQEAYQKLAFDRGVELYEGRKFKDAALFFERAVKYPVNKQANAKAYYWKGESLFALGEYADALREYDNLRNTSGAFATELYEQASYSMGYAYFKMKDYGEAATAFRRFANTTGVDKAQRADALLRVGDCSFLGRDYKQAIKWYDDALTAGTNDRDYALFQKGVCLGLDKRPAEKVDVLKKLLAEKPNSRYAADAKFQLGQTYLNMEKDADALAFYQQVLAQHPACPHIRESMLQSALIHKRQGDTNKAIEEFKAVVEKFPTMDGSRDALAGLKSIYVDLGRVGEYEAYVRGLKFVDPSTLELDEEYYQSAEKLYFEDKCPQAIGAFQDYLAKYPGGAYALNALFYQADCQYRTGNGAQALPHFEELIKRNAAQFLEPSLFAASDILFRDKRWEGALDHFTKLEQVAAVPQNTLAAQAGRMRCLRELGRTDEAATAAEKVLANTNAREDLKAEAGLVVAHGMLARNELDVAYTRFKAVATVSKNAFGAEAKYHMAYVRHLQKKYREAEQEVFDLVQKFPSYDFWKAKSFILLGDVYIQLDDRFQAKATLQSVIDHSTDPALVAEARRRLETITASEVQQNTPAPPQEITVPMPGSEGQLNENDR
ncbi:MAG: tetratricopeptide repeat protein [Flavobacteriales bacterium]|nr:tetratricopeptide repeat protein [Flavobacteriales bacterium]